MLEKDGIVEVALGQTGWKGSPGRLILFPEDRSGCVGEDLADVAAAVWLSASFPISSYQAKLGWSWAATGDGGVCRA